MLDICPNCNIPVIYYSKHCKAHRALAPVEVPTLTPQDRSIAVCRLSLEELLTLVADVFKVDAAELKRKRKGNKKPFYLARQLFSFVAQAPLGYKQREIAEFLDVTVSAVSNKIGIVRAEMCANQEMASYYKRILEHIART